MNSSYSTSWASMLFFLTYFCLNQNVGFQLLQPQHETGVAGSGIALDGKVHAEESGTLSILLETNSSVSTKYLEMDYQFENGVCGEYWSTMMDGAMALNHVDRTCSSEQCSYPKWMNGASAFNKYSVSEAVHPYSITLLANTMNYGITYDPELNLMRHTLSDESRFMYSLHVVPLTLSLDVPVLLN